MAEALQATHGVGLVIGRDQMEFSAAVFHQAWLARNGKIGYLGYSNLDNFIRKQLTQPVIPLKKGTGNETKDYFIITDLQKELKGNMEYYIKTGKVLPFSKMSL